MSSPVAYHHKHCSHQTQNTKVNIPLKIEFWNLYTVHTYYAIPLQNDSNDTLKPTYLAFSLSTQTPLLRKRLSDYHCIIFDSVRWLISPLVLLFMQEELCDQFWTSCVSSGGGLLRLKTRGGTWFLNDFRGALLFWATLKITGTLILLIWFTIAKLF